MATDDHPPGGAAPSPAEHPHRDWPYRRTAVVRYGVAVIAVIAAFSMRYAIYGDLNNRLAFTFFVPAAVVAAWYGGMGPGLFATGMGLLLGGYFSLLPQNAQLLVGVRQLGGLGMYAGTTILCVMLCENLHQSIRRLERTLGGVRHDHHFTPHSGTQDPAGGLAQEASLFAAVHGHGNWLFERSLFARYGVAVAVVIAAFVLRYWLFDPHDHRFPFILFVPAAMIAAWYGGMAPGLLATAAGLMLGDYFFLSEHEAMGPVRESERLAIGLYAVTTTLCVMLFENLHVHISRLGHALDRARQHHGKLQAETQADSAFSH